MSRKKNKKSFSDNLEFLFQERLLDDNAQDNLSMIEDNAKDDQAGQPLKKNNGRKSGGKTTKKTTKTNRKSFSSNLERFFKDSIEGVLDGVVTDVKRSVVGKGNKKAIGLDLLIQRTTEERVKTENGKKSNNSTTKRVTVLLDKEKLEELKRIAKEEKRRLHQIIGELVNQYLQENAS